MGTEYRLRFDCDDPGALLHDLSRLPSASASGERQLDFREAASGTGMPDATLLLEPLGAYFCDHGGNGREILGRVVARIVARCQRVTVEDYEP
ncbi:MAG: hypothetical protein IPQ07_39355 [Myxococcales bacterium]|nr:hypothetical protein [Myxococcales bacterium]